MTSYDDVLLPLLPRLRAIRMYPSPAPVLDLKPSFGRSLVNAARCASPS